MASAAGSAWCGDGAARRKHDDRARGGAHERARDAAQQSAPDGSVATRAEHEEVELGARCRELRRRIPLEHASADLAPVRERGERRAHPLLERVAKRVVGGPVAERAGGRDRRRTPPGCERRALAGVRGGGGRGQPPTRAPSPTQGSRRSRSRRSPAGCRRRRSRGERLRRGPARRRAGTRRRCRRTRARSRSGATTRRRSAKRRSPPRSSAGPRAGEESDTMRIAARRGRVEEFLQRGERSRAGRFGVHG